jgi:hypothetical protein
MGRRRRRNRQPPPLPPSSAMLEPKSGQLASLKGIYAGAAGFLVLSGPSLRGVDMGFLNERGVISIGVNNAAAFARTSMWTHGDPVKKFHHGIWTDPGIMKFSPSRAVKHRISLSVAELAANDPQGPPAQSCPNVYGLHRNSDFNPETWLSEDTINWGNSKKSATVNRHPTVLSTMIQAIKLAYYLGIRKLFLLGCDFYMEPGAAYSFQQYRTAGACRSNNHAYVTIAWMMDQLKPHFANAGFEVYNCNPRSNLKTFPFVDRNDAILTCRNGVPLNLDTEGYYERPGQPETTNERSDE